MGGAPDSIPVRLQRGEPVDVLIMAGTALDDLIAQGKVLAGSRVDLRDPASAWRFERVRANRISARSKR